MQKETVELIIDGAKIAHKHNLKFIDGKILEGIAIVTIQCQRGHEWKTTFEKLKNGEAKCQCCSGMRLTPTEKYIQSKGWAYKNKGKLLSLSFVSEDTEMLWETSDGTQFSATYNEVVKQDKWYGQINVPVEKLPGVLGVAHRHAEANGAKCLTTTGGGRRQILDWVCSDGHHFTARYDELLNRKMFCKVCKKESQQNTRRTKKPRKKKE